MELSYCTDWTDPMTNAITDHSELSNALIGLYDPVDFSIDSLFDSQPDVQNLEYYDYTPFNFNALPPLPSFPPPPPPPPTVTKTPSQLITSFSDPSIHSFHHNSDSCPPCPKRPKSCSNMFTFDPRHNDKINQGATTLSPQSVAARVRRRKISERTQELGKLVPGGTKLNTAEMFHAAFNYVKFLQAQVGILSLMSTFQGGMEGRRMMKKLLESSAVQEKLHGEGKCVVPVEVIGGLAEDAEIESNKGVKRDLDKFVGTIGL